MSVQPVLERILALARKCRDDGNDTEAARLAAGVLGLGRQCLDEGRLAEAEYLYRALLSLAPDLAAAHAGYAETLLALDQPAEALHHQIEACLNSPRADDFLRLARLWRRFGAAWGSHAAAGRALQLDPGLGEAQAELEIARAAILAANPALAEWFATPAIRVGTQAAKAPPNIAAGGRSMSYEAARQRAATADRAEARKLLEAMTRVRPTDADALSDLAATLRLLGANDEAANACCRALLLAPAHGEACTNMAGILVTQGLRQQARPFAEMAALLAPRLAVAWVNLAAALSGGVGSPFRAELASRRALALAPGDVGARNNLALALKAQGRLDEAVAIYRELVDAGAPVGTWSNLLLALQYASGFSREEIAHQHQDFGHRFEPEFRAARARYQVAPGARRHERLRVGYVSGDLCNHAVAYFAEPLLAHHDRTRFEIFAYYTRKTHDDVSERLAKRVDHWRNVFTLSDDALADLIAADRIDILVDLAGHTENNRLLVFARKPAPVQATWLGHPNTTGLHAVDWRFTDAYADPPGVEPFYTERLHRLPAVFCCYRPAIRFPERRRDGTYDVADTPARRGGGITFGCCNNFAKITPPVMALWSRLLDRVPGARLLVETTGLEIGEMRHRVTERFAAHGIGSDRLLLVPRDSQFQYLRYNDIDIALDPFPCNGGTTTCDALWMGVPLVTLAGESFVSRLGGTLLHAIGHPEWIAGDEEEYLGIAADLAADLPRLNALRHRLRGEMEASPLMDEAGFARAFEAGYDAMWRDWLQRTDAEAASGMPWP